MLPITHWCGTVPPISVLTLHICHMPNMFPKHGECYGLRIMIMSAEI